MNLAAALESARQGCLYPAVILHGGDPEARQQAAIDLARTLLCEAPAAAEPAGGALSAIGASGRGTASGAGPRPCGVCRHCRRIVWPGDGKEAAPFHPDFLLLRRDLKTATSVEGARELLKSAQLSPFEARGQVFVVANAETLTGEAANALLKSLEEPHTTAPRHFLLLAPSRLDLLPTLRSRSLAVFLGPAAAIDGEAAARLGGRFGDALQAYLRDGASIHLLVAAEALIAAGGWEDPRSGHPWTLAAAAILRALDRPPGELPAGVRRACLGLAEALLGAPAWRVRGITAERIMEGLVARHLAGLAAEPAAEPAATARRRALDAGGRRSV